MVLEKEIPWQERLNIIDFEVIREQMARKKGVPTHQISERAVRAQMKAMHRADERNTRRLYPQDLRPVRAGK